MTHNGYQHMVLDQYVHQLRRIDRQRKERLHQIATRAQALAYQQEIRTSIRRAFSPRPPKTPLNAQITGTIEQPAFRIEKLIFESRPGFPVTANLHVPHDLQEPAPCVLGTCGHSGDGKACPLYQAFCRRLAHCGFVVLIYDPINQGERDQYFGLKSPGVPHSCTQAHNMIGKQLQLVDEFFGMWRAWDGIRALDYLLSRPEVDPARVGLTGNSGGGTMTTWLWAIEDRFTMAAPSCFVTTFLHNLENELPADCEQCPPGVIGDGLEMADFIIAGAPKPVLLLGQAHDYFDRRGLQEAYQDIERFYRILGAPETDTELFIGPQGHGYSIHNQQAMVAFFARQAQIPVIQKKEVELLVPEMLYATTQGQVMETGAIPIYELIADLARDRAERRSAHTADQLQAALQQTFDLPQECPLPPYRILRPDRRENEIWARYAIETQGHIRAILHRCLPLSGHPFSLDVESAAHLYLPHVSAEQDLIENAWVQSLKSTSPLYSLDVRGLGESMPEEERPEFFQPYGMDYMLHAYGLMLGQSYLGRRLHDLLSTMDLIAHNGADEIHLYGRGQGTLLALFAALLHDRAASLTLVNGPRSLIEWTQTPLVSWPAANFARDLLRICDLQDCIDALDIEVQILDPWGPDMKPLSG